MMLFLRLYCGISKADKVFFHPVRFYYDYVGNKITELTAADAERDLAFTSMYEYNENGQVTKAYNAANDYITNTYDALGNLASATDYAGTPAAYTYDAPGNTGTCSRNTLGYV